MKKLLIVLIGCLAMGLPIWAADVPDAYQVEVSPSSFAVNQSVDLTIKALKNWQLMKNYQGSIYIELTGDFKYADEDYTVPNGGIGEFALTDQGIKTYSKGLRVSKPGNFVVLVSDFMNDNLSGSTSIVVTSANQQAQKNITILSPSAGLEETSSTVDLMATTPELPNTRMQILLNDLAVSETTSDANGLIVDTIPGLKVGTNYIQVKALSLAGEVVGLSEKVVFVYKAQSTDLFRGITATPNQDLKLWSKVRFELITDENVSSAKLLFNNGVEYPLDKQKESYFVKELMMTHTGENTISATLSAGTALTKTYENILSLTVKDNIQIGEVRIKTHPDHLWALELSRDTHGGTAEQYAIKYGLAQDDLAGLFTSTGTTALLSGFTYGKEYFFQVFATTTEQIPEWVPSEVISFVMPIATGTPPELIALSGSALPAEEQEIEHPAPKLPTCSVQNIKVATQKIGNKYYLVRNAVKNTDKYLIYKSDFADNSNKTFIGETKLSRFEYPFDKTLEYDQYAYYTVEALCTDGEKLVIANAQKVQVGPLEDMLLIISVTVLLYLLYRVYQYSEG